MATADADLAKLSVTLNAAPLVVGSPRLTAQVAADGTFSLADIPAGSYALRIANGGTLLQVAGLIGDVDSMDLPAEISANVTGAVVVVGQRASSILATIPGSPCLKPLSSSSARISGIGRCDRGGCS